MKNRKKIIYSKNKFSKIYLINQSHQWFTKNLSGLDFTWARDGRSSCIVHALFNCKMKEYINKVSVFKFQYCCDGLFDDDIDLVTPSKQALKENF
ncbi:hypothetical protein H8356DRAFT_1348203 [Neocallimastix lanati (nom. inval.)]|nr:hypothetical protein H8356DRAFT_1348203 [Neocallimastix sp. JGI-2020a]